MWLASKLSVVKPSTYHSLESAWRIHVEPMWGPRQVGLITHTSVQTWMSELGTKRSATTTKRAFGVLSGILAGAVKDRRIAANSCDGVRTKAKRAKERVYLDDAQLARLAREAGSHRALVLVLGYCGVRWGEAIGLRVKDVDFDRGRLAIEQNAVQVNGRMHIGTPKSHAARSVPFPAFLKPALQEQCRDKLPSALVFPGTDGGYLRRPSTSASSNSWWMGAVRRSGVPHLTLHDLRHTAASLAISAGANVKSVQRMLGHGQVPRSGVALRVPSSSG